MELKLSIYIAGESCLLNQLMQSTIETELGHRCILADDLERVTEQIAAEPDSSALVLVDYSNDRLRESLFDLAPRLLMQEANGEGSTGELSVAIYNAGNDHMNVTEAIRRGIKGVFFTTDSMQQVLKGIRKLLDGDVWVPREILVDAATMRTRRHEDELLLQSHLTMREIEILSLVSTGATNESIAAELYISPHTVKTHLYNIYQKIDVENRLHAAMWAEKHLDGHLDYLRKQHASPAPAS